MKQTIYCSTFYCEHYEGGKCLSPILHVNNVSSCKEFTLSEEKLNAYPESRANAPNKPTKYAEYDMPNTTLRIRQK